jgi:hypothetical protein
MPAATGAAVLLALLAGCANPGPPLPPTLKLPQVVEAASLSAVRVGDQVSLHWTTPTHTTDKLLIAGPIAAVICRDPAPAAKPAAAKPAVKLAPPPCSPVLRVPVTPGASAAADPLSVSLLHGPLRLLAYRVELQNAAGHSAGPSAAVFAVAGEAQAPVAGFRARLTKPGVVLEWTRDTAASPTGPGPLAQPAVTTVELTRTTLASPPAASAAPSPARPAAGPQKPKEPPPPVRFQAGESDAGGTLDRTAQIGFTYSYTAERVRRIPIAAGQTLEIRSAPSPAVTVAVQDIFPPETPAGLVAVPGFFRPGDQGSPGTPAAAADSERPAIDLSWDPDIEPRVAGYRVYRREADSGAWQLLPPALVPSAAWHDTAVVSGRAYAYRVSAVSTAGNESAPTPAVTETAPSVP